MQEKEILDSWKEIASYLRRSERTCRRWEKDFGLPIYRMDSVLDKKKETFKPLIIS